MAAKIRETVTAGSDSEVYPPYYPRDGTYADLLCWHMDYWGTRPKGRTTVNGERWTENEFKQEFWGEESGGPNARNLLKNWRGNGSAPGSEHGATVSRILFGDNLMFRGWVDDLENARKRSQGKKGNPQTAKFPDPPPIVPPTANIPHIATHFMGRSEEVDALARMLASPNGGLAVLVQGGPGIGKTELTKAIARHEAVAHRFAERRFFVPLETATSAAAMQDAITIAIGGDPAHGLAAALQSLHGRDTLLLLDNLETPWEPRGQRAATEQVLAELAAISGIVVLASFRGIAAVMGLRWHKHQVEPFASAIAAELFTSIAGPEFADDPHLGDFIRVLGGIPLAIDLVARRAHGRAHLEPLWREWLEVGAELAEDPDFEADRLTSLTHSIELSLRSPRMSNPAWRLFRILGCLPDGLIPEEVAILLDDDAFQARERLCHMGLAVERFGKVDLLPPIREHAFRRYRPEGKDNERWISHYLDMANHSVGAVNGMNDVVDAGPYMRGTFSNIEAAFRAHLETTPLSEALATLDAIATFAVTISVPTSLFSDLALVCQENNDLECEAICMKHLANLLHLHSESEDARLCYQRALALFRQTGDEIEQAQCLTGLGAIAIDNSDYASARNLLDEALGMLRPHQQPLLQANCCDNLSQISFLCLENDAALRLSEEALSLYREANDNIGIANCKRQQAVIYLAMKKFDHATSAFDEALTFYRGMGNRLGEANCIMGLGNFCFDSGAYEKAGEFCQQACDLYQETGNVQGEGYARLGLGDACRELGDFAGAKTHYEAAASFHQSIDHPLGHAHALVGLGRIGFAMHDYDVAERMLNEALSIYELIGDLAGQANCHEQLGDSAVRQTNYESARTSYRKAIDLYRRLCWTENEAVCVTKTEEL